MTTLLEQVKAAGQDYEWYPTTDAIIDRLIGSMKVNDIRVNSILDIGAGNGKVLKRISEYDGEDAHKICGATLYAIEKSQVLVGNLPPEVYVIGTDFRDQTLIDKQVDVIFCNPPYSEFAEWAEKIILEANCNSIYLVIPQRWVDSKPIQAAIERRGMRSEVIYSTDFMSSEDRQARAKVDLVRFEFKSRNARFSDYRRVSVAEDPFNVWFEDNFKLLIHGSDHGSEHEENKHKAYVHEQAELVKGQSLIPRLVELYNADMRQLLHAFDALQGVNPQLLKEIRVTIDGVKQALRSKIAGLKNLYWQELFNNLDKVTDRLTHKSRSAMLSRLTSHTKVDFTADNAYAVIIWVMKNANQYYQTQLLELYKQLSRKENIQNYKSNQRIPEDNWRYLRDAEPHTHYRLDYRTIWSCYKNFDDDYNSWQCRQYNGLHDTTGQLLDDICTIAHNLGFEVFSRAKHYEWEPGQRVDFLYQKEGTFMEVRAYKNGNVHIKFDQAFMKAFCIEAGRLNGWLKSPQEAAEEMDIPVEEASRFFQSNLTLLPGDMKLLPAA